MAVCKKCGKRGFFLRVSVRGLCDPCEVSQQIADERELRKEELKRKERERISEFHDRFQMTMNNQDYQKQWSFWDDSIHDETDQLTRQQQIVNSIPIFIDTIVPSATFMGTRENAFYSTSLIDCTCADFTNREKPCKHIYRLQYELNHRYSDGLFDVDAEIFMAFNSLNESSKFEFLHQLRSLTVQRERCHTKNDKTNELISAGFYTVLPIEDYSPYLNQMTKDQIILALAKQNITGFKANWSKVKIIDFASQNNAFLKKHFKNLVNYKVSTKFLPWAESVRKSYDVQFNRYFRNPFPTYE